MGFFSWLNGKARVQSNDTPNKIGRVAIEPYAFTEAVMSGPFTSGNLAMYLIHGTDTSSTNYISLEEALAKQKVTIQETGTVSQLKIKNDGDEVVFIQSGDIVKGGRQDRTLQHDMILDSKSGFVPINSFCVESGRWHKREQEDDSRFSQSNHYLSNKHLRIAARRGRQDAVWAEVGKLQCRSAINAGVPLHRLQHESSQSSLQLTLDMEKLKECTQRYVDDLVQMLKEKSDVLGCAFAVNGEMSSVDIYSCNSLFQKMGEKLLRAAAVEAFSEQKEAARQAAPTISEVISSLKDLADQKADVVAVSGKAQILKQETPKNLLYETQDLIKGGQWLHRNYTVK